MRNRIYVFLDITWRPNQEGFLQFSCECLGIGQLMELIKEEFPDLKFGYFNPSIERIKGDFEMDYAK